MNSSFCFTINFKYLQDDKQLGMKSTALHFGDNSPAILTAIASTSIASLALSGTFLKRAWENIISHYNY